MSNIGLTDLNLNYMHTPHYLARSRISRQNHHPRQNDCWCDQVCLHFRVLRGRIQQFCRDDAANADSGEYRGATTIPDHGHMVGVFTNGDGRHRVWQQSRRFSMVCVASGPSERIVGYALCVATDRDDSVPSIFYCRSEDPTPRNRNYSLTN